MDQNKNRIMTIFEKSDFTLCDVPVPKGYPQSQTHVGVFPYEGRIYLTSSPFPCPKENIIKLYIKAAIRKLTKGLVFPIIRGECFENPLVYVNDYQRKGCFNLMQSRPLMEQPDPYYGYPSFNSDPDLYVEDGYIYVINRAIFRTSLTPGRKRDEYIIRLYMIKGKIDCDRFKLYSTSLFYESDELSVSPCITKFKGHYIFTNLFTNCYNDGESFESLRLSRVDRIEDINKMELCHHVEIDVSEFIPWHMSLFSHNDSLYAIVACVKRGISSRCYQMLGEFSEDLSKLKIYKQP